MEKYFDFFEDDKNQKIFNTTGLCVKDKHYMVNIDKKLRAIVRLVQRENYFVINRPRQFGKTTTLNELEKILKTRYKVIKLNFEGVGEIFASESEFCGYFSGVVNEAVGSDSKPVLNFIELARVIVNITKKQEVVLIIDEVDKTSNNKVFLNFIGMLRSLYLSRTAGDATTFKSVILAGVHDVKNLKLKFRDDTDTRYNSPWNIAVNFDVDMSFNEEEIASMLIEYSIDNNLKLNIEELSREIYKFTSGYPFLVSRICKIVDEELLPNRNIEWNKSHIQKAIKILLEENNTLFDDLVKNLENNKELYDYIYNLIVLNIPLNFNASSPVINIGVMFGYLAKDKDNNTIISNKIIREVMYNYMIAKTEILSMNSYNYKSNFITDDNGLDMEKVLLKFQQFMKENYSTRDKEFLERQGVLLFLAFIKPIINGVGFEYKEAQISEERRLDIVIQYNNHKYIIETKIWHGDVAHQKGLKQLTEYLNIEALDKGYLLIFNFNKNKEYINEKYKVDGKEIFSVVV